MGISGALQTLLYPIFNMGNCYVVCDIFNWGSFVTSKDAESIGYHSEAMPTPMVRGILLFSRLFRTNYPYKSGHLGIQKFNIISLRSKAELVPLGGINVENLSKLNSVISQSFACLSAIKKKPAKLINRLF